MNLSLKCWPPQRRINGALAAASSRMDRDLDATSQALPTFSPLSSRSNYVLNHPILDRPQPSFDSNQSSGFNLHANAERHACPSTTPAFWLPFGALDPPSDLHATTYARCYRSDNRQYLHGH
ncbi:unnamed protein product [Dicrocoelium dendriticum]|nr:unnamed protein product [Dicrocoelium dendriticum]